MFGFLKKKLSQFVDSIVKPTEEQPPQPPKEPASEAIELKQPLPQQEKPKTETPSPIVQATETKQVVIESEKPPALKEPEKPVSPSKQTPVPAPLPPARSAQPPAEQKEFKPKIGVLDRVKIVFSDSITLSPQQVEPSLQELEMALLESDVSIPTSQHMVETLRSSLEGKQIKKSEAAHYVNNAIRAALLDVLVVSSTDSDLIEQIKGHKQRSTEPFSILFIGPNGAGKTTTIAKLAKQFTEAGFSCVISASDTFRAAAIDQITMHGEKLGVKVIKHKYGADPAAVAFDAVAHARAKKLDVVLIDTAGRQDTSANLIAEMQKIARVVKPTAKIFIGETIAGHALLEQITTFHKAIGLDGIILTKLDCDAKGGGTLSVAFETKLSIYYVGLGQEYNDLVRYDPQLLLGKMLEAS